MIKQTRKIEFKFLSDEVAICYNEIESQEPMDIHQHDFYELVIIERGEGIHFTETHKSPMRAGDVFLIKPNEAHGYKNTKGLELMNVFYRPDELDLPEADLREIAGYHVFFELEPLVRDIHGYKSRLRLSLDQLSVANSLISGIKKQLDAQKPGFRFMTFTYFVQLIFFLSRCYEKSGTAQSSLLLQLGKVTAYIENNYIKSITLDELAGVAGMSKRTLIRKFKDNLGTTPIDYLLRCRVAKASSLLLAGKSTISEIAFEVGFSDSNYFSRQFKKITGLSPRSYWRK